MVASGHLYSGDASVALGSRVEEHVNQRGSWPGVTGATALPPELQTHIPVISLFPAREGPNVAGLQGRCGW